MDAAPSAVAAEAVEAVEATADPPLTADLVDHLVRVRRLTFSPPSHAVVVHHHGRALLRHQERVLAADSSASASDDRYPTCQPLSHADPFDVMWCRRPVSSRLA
jgi:hypothetical protein